jgi:small GTP-binding protein
MHKYKVVLRGSTNIGKTSFIHNITYRNPSDYKSEKSTVGSTVYPVVFQTTKGRVTVNLWDTAGNLNYGGIVEAYINDSDVVIFMFSYISPTSLNFLKEDIKFVKRVLGKKHFKAIVCGFHAEYKSIVNPSLNIESITNGTNWPVFDIDSRDRYNPNYHIYESMVRLLTDEVDIRFTGKPYTI